MSRRFVIVVPSKTYALSLANLQSKFVKPALFDGPGFARADPRAPGRDGLGDLLQAREGRRFTVAAARSSVICRARLEPRQMNLQHEFDVPASPQATLKLLLDAQRVVSCMPGATLVDVTGDGTWKTTMAVKLGPVGMDFVNDVRVVENDVEAGTVRLAAKARDKRGKGGADASVDARLIPTDGGTRVTMNAEVKVSGHAAQLGRPSVIQDVSTR